MKVQSLEHAPKVAANLEGHIMFSGEKTEIVHLLLKAGEGLDTHKNPLDAIFYCLEGRGVLNVENQEFVIQKDDCISIPSMADRSWKNTGDGVLRLLVIKQKG